MQSLPSTNISTSHNSIKESSTVCKGKVLANGINIYYELHGSSRHPTLVLIGGLTRDHSIWNNLLPELSKHFRVLVYDNRGAGQTDKPENSNEYSSEIFADDLKELLNAIKIKTAVNIIGHSMGGFAAQFFASKYPDMVGKLMLCNTCLVQPEAGQQYLKGRLSLIQQISDHNDIRQKPTFEEMVRSALPWIFSDKYLTQPEQISKIIDEAKNNRYPQPIHALKSQVQACLNHNSTKIARKIMSPTLVVTGNEDRVMTREVSAQLQQQISNSRLEIIPGAAHMLQLEVPNELTKLILQFFAPPSVSIPLFHHSTL